MTINFYDIPGPLPGKAWSPNTLKTRFALNFKNLPYQTTWVEYPDIESLYHTLGVQPTSKQPDGVTPYYTLPIIVDSSPPNNTGPVILTDSWDIAVYLDSAYPEPPRLFPKGTKALQAAFQDLWMDAFLSHAPPIILPRTPEVALNAPSAEFFHRTRTELFGKPLSEIEPHGEGRKKHFEAWEGKLGKIAKVYEKSEGKYITGDEVV